MLFNAVNLLALGGWLVLCLAPRKPFPLTAVLYLGVALLCLIYAIALGMALAGSGVGSPWPLSVETVRGFFASDTGVLIGWTHYLAFDLFTGLWIARDADAKQFSRGFQLPFLLLTMLVGPVGLLAWLFVRERRARIGARAKVKIPRL